MYSSPFKNKIFFPGHSCQIYLIRNENGKISYPETLSKIIQPVADDPSKTGTRRYEQREHLLPVSCMIFGGCYLPDAAPGNSR